VIAAVFLAVSDKSVSAIVKGVTGLVAFAGARLLS
jgi:hypothetical protein